MGGREFESRSLHLKLETKLHEERGLSGCRKGLKTVPLAQALLSLKPAKTNSENSLSGEVKEEGFRGLLGTVKLGVDDSHAREPLSRLGGSSWLSNENIAEFNER